MELHLFDSLLLKVVATEVINPTLGSLVPSSVMSLMASKQLRAQTIRPKMVPSNAPLRKLPRLVNTSFNFRSCLRQLHRAVNLVSGRWQRIGPDL